MRLILLVTVGAALALLPSAWGQDKVPIVRAWGITFRADCSEQELRKQLAEAKIDLVPVDGQVRFDLRRGDRPIGEIVFAGGKVVLAKQTWVVSRDAGAIAFARSLLDAAKSIAASSKTDAEFGEDMMPDGTFRWADFMFSGKRISVTESDFPMDGRRVHLVSIEEFVI